MGLWDELKKLTRPYDEDGYDDVDDAEVVDDPPRDTPRSNPFSGFTAEPPAPARTSFAPQRPVRPKEGRVVSMGHAGAQMQVVLIRPERFETAAEVADHLRDHRPVLVNLETTPKDVTRRLVDFLSGVTYAIDGNIKKVAANIYIITPANVDLVGDLMDELQSGSVYF